MKKENLQAIYENASTEALNIRSKYKEVKADIEDLEEELADLQTESTAYEGIVYHAIQAGAEDNRGWMQNHEDEDEDWNEDEEEEEDEDKEEEWYDPCEYCVHDCARCAMND